MSTDNKPAPANPFVQAEEAILDFWDKSETFKRSVAKDAPRGNFVFFEGPPTANGRPGIHHVLARAFKDVLPRYKTMRGFRVQRKAGWDTHGLPVELQVEKQLGISGKPEIEKYGIAEFNRQCRESVWQFKDEWERLTRRMGYWVDMENPYITYDNSYIESLWSLLKEINEKGFLYKGHKVVPHCPRCGTALSSHEVAQGYKLTKDNSVYLKFKVQDGNDKVKAGDFILAWTTTPWTLPGNVALAVGANIDYVRVSFKKAISQGDSLDNKIEAPYTEVIDEFIVLAKDRLENLNKLNQGVYNIVAEFKGSDLIGLHYQPLFDIPAIKAVEGGSAAYQVIPADFVTTSDGTGVVHTAVMYGEDDYNLGQASGLPKFHTVDESGLFIADLEKYGLAGKFVKDAETEKIITQYLESSGQLFAQEIYEHDYPFCWRCDTPLVYYAKDSWFLKTTAVQAEMIASNDKINWVPEHIKTGRFGEWLANVKDWAISRERYWGTPLPIWVCDSCPETHVIGSVRELGKKVGKELDLNSDIHRPEIDGHTYRCPRCGGTMHRVKEVFDCWFDSGAMPFAQYHYPFDNRELIELKLQYPADFICEAIDQTRGWFYTLLAVANLVGRGNPYKNVICLGHINDKFGKKMSKSKGNVVDPWDVISQYGIDAVREHLYTINQPGEGKRYDIEDVKDVFRKNIMLLSNVHKFYEMYEPELKPESLGKTSASVLDRWILSKLWSLNTKIAEELEKYHVYEAAREIPVFIDELSTWYLRRSRDRFKSDDENDKQAALATTRAVLLDLSKIIAPFMPFIAEGLWQKLSGNNFASAERSVHLENWPEAGVADAEVMENMENVRRIVELGLAKRDEAGIKIRQMLAKIVVKTKSAPLSPEYIELIKDELNLQAVEFVAGEDKLEAELDTVLTPELKQEGIRRELVRFINLLRKESGLSIGDQARVYLAGGGAEVREAAEKMKAAILKDTLGASLEFVEALPETIGRKSVKLEGSELEIGLAR